MLLTEGWVPVLQIFSPTSVTEKVLNFYLYGFFFFSFFEELKCVTVYLSISDGLIAISMQWHLIWELIKRDRILLPILGHSWSPVKPSQLPLQMLSHPSHQNTHHPSEKHHVLGCTWSIQVLSYLPDECWLRMGGRKSCCKKKLGQRVSQLTSSFAAPCGACSRKPLPIPPYRLTLQDLDLCVCSYLSTSLPQALFFCLAGKIVISIKMYSIFIHLAP